MPRFSCHWLPSLLMALVLAVAPPVAAGGHHGDVSCLESLAVLDQAMAWEKADSEEPLFNVASPCCMPCLQCGTPVMAADSRALASFPILYGPAQENPLGPPDPIERPPRA